MIPVFTCGNVIYGLSIYTLRVLNVNVAPILWPAISLLENGSLIATLDLVEHLQSGLDLLGSLRG